MKIAKSHIDKHGRILIPNLFRKSLHLKPGEDVILYKEEEGLKIRTFKDLIVRASALTSFGFRVPFVLSVGP